MKYMNRLHRKYGIQSDRYDKSRIKLIAISILLAIALFITGYEIKLLSSELLIRRMISQDIDYEAFRELKLGEYIADKADSQAADLKNKYPKLQELPYMDEAGCVTFSMMAASYDLTDNRLAKEKLVLRGIWRLAQCQQFQELYGYYKAILSDLEYFPVPKVSDQSADISYVDSWYMPRTYGGDRKHEGTDLMASNNVRGFFPVISITDGTVEKMGWLEQGGYRIGIRSAGGGYFYYAHLYSYAPELEQGDCVIAGQLLGFMGDSGYGSEGTIGQFDVHLHLGIYVNTDDGEMSVNPYMILKELEKYRNEVSYGSLLR
jgi:peptidoglycan LD-endopeptidase LytH